MPALTKEVMMIVNSILHHTGQINNMTIFGHHQIMNMTIFGHHQIMNIELMLLICYSMKGQQLKGMHLFIVRIVILSTDS